MTLHRAASPALREPPSLATIGSTAFLLFRSTLQQDRLNLRLPGDYIAAEDPLLFWLFSSFPVSDTVCLESVDFLRSLFSIFIFKWFVLAGPSTAYFCLFLDSARVNKKKKKIEKQQRILAHINSISRHAVLESDFADQNPHRILALISILPNQPYLNDHLQFNPYQSYQSTNQ